MAAPNASTFEVVGGAGPYRPGVADFEGCALQNHPRFPPTPGTHPTAGLINTLGFEAIAACAMIPAAIVTVQQIAGVYSVLLFVAPNTTLRPTDVTVTKNGIGDVTVTLLTTKLPAQTARATVTLNEDATLLIRAVDYNSGGARGARVKMFTTVPAAAEGAFTLTIY